MGNHIDTRRSFLQSALAIGASQLFRIVAIAAAATFFGSTAARADDVVFEATQSDTARGHFDQLAQENGQFLLPHPQANCGETSVANSFVFLQDQGITGLGGAAPNSGPGYAPIGYDTITTLDGYTGNTGSGTTTSQLVQGKENYLMSLQNDGYGIRDANGNQIAIQTVGQSAPGLGGFSQMANGPWIGGVTSEIPTAEFIQEQLDAGEDVEMLFGWADDDGNLVGGAHWVNVYAIDFDETENEGSISFIDPEASANGAYTNGTGDGEPIESLSLDELVDGFLSFSYKGGASNIEADDDPTGAANGDIVSVIAESPVAIPEPASFALLGAGVLALCGRRSRKLS